MQCGYKIEWKLIIGSGPRQKEKQYGFINRQPMKDV
jgi:hypothetical protein